MAWTTFFKMAQEKWFALITMLKVDVQTEINVIWHAHAQPTCPWRARSGHARLSILTILMLVTMKVAIIGAGASGLCCARHLGKYPDYFQIKVLEQSDVVGGTWVYTPSGSGEDMNVHSSMYKNMR